MLIKQIKLLKKTTGLIVRAFIFFLFCFLLQAVETKWIQQLEDYLQPSPVRELKLSAFTDKIVVSWSYPEKIN